MDCPSPETLRQLCDGKLSPADEERLVTHIDSCTQCQTLIEQFSASDSGIAQMLKSEASGSESLLLRKQLSELKSDRPSSANGHTTRFQDLSPWIDAGDGVLGRIDEYDLVRCIGRGGMGVVFEAFDRKLQRPVALKLMSPALLTAESNSERFLREARTAAAINHPNVVSIYAVSKVQELPYLVMELVDGQSLQQKLEQESHDDIDQICELAAQIADGLAAAHANGVVHRDIKPANILIEHGTERVKLTDFGLARRTSDELLTHSGTLLGTPEYLAPEQVDSGEVDYRADLFSLGSVIYHMCVGMPPYSSNSIASTLHAVATATAPTLLNAKPSVPAWLSDLVAQLHAKKPDDRPANATAVAKMLRSQQRPAIVVRQDQRKTDKRSFVGIGIAMLIAVLLIGFSLLVPPSSSQSSVFMAENSAELMEYVEEQEGDLNIVLSSDGPYHLDAMQIEGRSLTVVAGEGDQPTLIIGAEPDETVIHCEDGQFEFVGLRIELEQDEDLEDLIDEESEENIESMIVCSSGSMTLRDCVIQSGVRRCLSLFEAECHLSQCQLFSEDTAIFFESSDATSVQLEETNIESQIGFEITGPMEGRIVLDACSFDGLVAFELMYSDNQEPRLGITSTGCQFLCGNGLLSLYDVPEAIFQADTAADFLPSLDWQGTNNRYTEIRLLVFGDADDNEKEISLGEWLEQDAALDIQQPD